MRLTLPALLLCLLAACGPARLDLLGGTPGPGTDGLAIAYASDDPLPAVHRPAASRPKVIAFSGGGPDGAFGAGYVLGRLDRSAPQADVVTGVSIGALVGALAFAGETERLKALFAGGDTAPLGDDLNPIRAVFAGSLSNGAAYAALLDHAIDAAVISRIAAEHRAGRRLFVATTNLDTMRMTIWDLGALAASNNPGAPDLLRRILLASASVPGAYPPVVLPDPAGPGLHGDGGVTGTFYVPRLRSEAVTVVVNNTLGADPPQIRITAAGAAQRALSTTIRAQTRDRLALERARAEVSGTNFAVVALPDGWPAARLQDWSREAMARTFRLGQSLGAMR